MPRMPNPPRDGHPGKPPRRRRKGAEDSVQPGRKPRSYGQSADIPKPSGAHDRVDLEHESLEELAGEPIREEGEDEKAR